MTRYMRILLLTVKKHRKFPARRNNLRHGKPFKILGFLERPAGDPVYGVKFR